MRNLEKELKNKVIDYEKLIKYGFVKEKNKYSYKKKICNEQFEIIVEVKEDLVISKLIDLANEEEYALVDVEDAVGEFVGKVRTEYEEALNDIINNCTVIDVFKSSQAKEVIKYIKEKYNDELEFLWEKFDDTAISRNKQNNKWYILFCVVPENKIGIDSDKKVEIIDIRYQKDETEKIIDFKKIYPGYHMNKKSWITIKLDNSIETKEIFKLIDNSYNLSKSKK